MDAFLNILLTHPDLSLLLALPVLGALAAGLGHWLGWRVLFGPIPALKWQSGLLGAKSQDITRTMGERLMPRISLSEFFHLMEPERIAAHISDSVLLRLEDYVDAIMTEKYAVLWANLPMVLRQRIYNRVRKQLPAMLDNLVDDMAENMDELTDLPTLLQERLGSEPAQLTALLESCLQSEKQFLLQSGVLIGVLLGGAELALLSHWAAPGWALPCLAIATTIFAYWLPRRLLFYPMAPISTLGRVWQGYLYRQQPGFARLLAHQLVESVFTIRSLMQVLMSGPVARRTRAMIKRHLRPLLEAGLVRTTIQLMMGVRGYADIKQLAIERAVSTTMGSLADAEFNHDRTRLIEGISQHHFQDIPPNELFQLVHPLLAEEEWLQYLIVIAVGLGVGMLEWAWLVLF